MKPERRPQVDRGPLRGPRRSASRPAIDRLLPPDLPSGPPVADWLVFLAELLTAEAMEEFADRGSIP